MAFVSQDKKKTLSVAVKKICKKYGVKATLAVRHHSTLVLNIKSGAIDFISDYNETTGNSNRLEYTKQFAETYIRVNEFHIDTYHSGVAAKFLKEIKAAMQGEDFFDHSDAMTDYFHCSHYIDINIGKWNQPYIYDKTIATTLVA